MNVFPIYYFPPIPWFALAVREETILLDPYQYYRKQHFTTRTYIKSPNGVLPLIIPVGRKGQKKRINEKTASTTDRWREVHWRSVQHSYRNSAFFEYFESQFQHFFLSNGSKLVPILKNTIEVSLECLGIRKKILLTNEFKPVEEYENDYREVFIPQQNQIPEWFNPIPYYQVFGEFEAGLSIIDLICNAGPEGRSILNRSIDEKKFYQYFKRHAHN